MERKPYDDAHLRALALILQKELEPERTWGSVPADEQERFLVIATRLATVHKAFLLGAVLDEIDARA